MDKAGMFDLMFCSDYSLVPRSDYLSIHKIPYHQFTHTF